MATLFSLSVNRTTRLSSPDFRMRPASLALVLRLPLALSAFWLPRQLLHAAKTLAESNPSAVRAATTQPANISTCFMVLFLRPIVCDFMPPIAGSSKLPTLLFPSRRPSRASLLSVAASREPDLGGACATAGDPASAALERFRERGPWLAGISKTFASRLYRFGPIRAARFHD